MTSTTTIDINFPPIPPTGQLLRTHTLAHEIITRHDPVTHENGVFDLKQLSFLRHFVTNPSAKAEILRQHDMVDAEGDVPGTRANKVHGNLVGYCIARHGLDNPPLEEREVEMLKAWFEGPVWEGSNALEGWKRNGLRWMRWHDEGWEGIRWRSGHSLVRTGIWKNEAQGLLKAGKDLAKDQNAVDILYLELLLYKWYQAVWSYLQEKSKLQRNNDKELAV
jgi:hypothetical protein